MASGKSQDRFTQQMFQRIEVRMRILDNDSDKKINNATLCLTKSEAEELRDTLEGVLAKPKDNHGHIPDYESNKELTVCVYDSNDLDSFFHDRIKKLIKEDH